MIRRCRRCRWICWPVVFWAGPRSISTSTVSDAAGLVLIDRGTAQRDHWTDLQPEQLGRIGIYEVWRLDRSRLEQRSQTLQGDGVDADWREPRPERF